LKLELYNLQGGVLLATFIKILPSQNIKRFDNPPEFSGEQRKQMFAVQNWVLDLLGTFTSPINKVGFVLQLGYFKAVNKFYTSKKYHQKDVEYVARSLKINFNKVKITDYKDRTFLRHQETILEETGFKKFTPAMKELLIKEAELLTSRQSKPRLIFMSLVDFLQTKKIQVPSYNTVAEIITESLKEFERNLVQIIDSTLTEDEKKLVEDLLEKEDSEIVSNRYTL